MVRTAWRSSPRSHRWPWEETVPMRSRRGRGSECVIGASGKVDRLAPTTRGRCRCRHARRRSQSTSPPTRRSVPPVRWPHRIAPTNVCRPGEAAMQGPIPVVPAGPTTHRHGRQVRRSNGSDAFPRTIVPPGPVARATIRRRARLNARRRRATRRRQPRCVPSSRGLQPRSASQRNNENRAPSATSRLAIGGRKGPAIIWRDPFC
jgi:hypothetical protein